MTIDRRRLACVVALACALVAGEGARRSAFASGQNGTALLLRVEEQGGSVVSGRASWKKDGLELETGGKKKTLPYSRIAALEEVEPEALATDAERAADRAELEKRRRALDEKPDADAKKGALAWSRLGAWARTRGLDADARTAFEKAVSLDADAADARRALGFAKDEDGSWKPASEVFLARRAKAGEERGPLLDLARWAAKNGLDPEAIETLGPFARKDPFERAVLDLLRPSTDRYRQRTPPLAFPLRGRWRGSDAQRHHEKKAYAIYALDFNKEVDGQWKKGEGTGRDDYYSFGEPVHAAQDGTVASMRDGEDDLPIGKLGELDNSILLEHATGEYTAYNHLKKGSIAVKLGDKVQRGDVIARVGNSGRAGIPHLHFSLVGAGAAVSLPWRCEGYSVVAEDGTVVPVRRGRPLEGQLIEMGEVEPEKR